MNERIRELIEQATESTGFLTAGDSVKPLPVREFNKEKFAELIIKECTEQVRGQYLPVMEDKEMMKDTHWNGYVQCGVDSAVAIREHFFGVEE